jgi:hypothetical protein
VYPTPGATQCVRDWARAALRVEAGLPPVDQSGRRGLETLDLVAAVRRHRLVDLLDSHAHDLELPAEVADTLGELRASTKRGLMVQVLEIARVRDLLDASGVPSLVVKGSALAVQSAGDPIARGLGDIDLLVPVEFVEVAHCVLNEHGWKVDPSWAATPGTWAWRQLLWSYNEMKFEGPATTVDLHWRLDPTLDALPGFAEVWSRRETVDLGGVRMPTLSRRDALAHTCLHSAKDQWRWLRSLVDVHRLARDPLLWEDRPLLRLEAETLAITRELLDLPAEVPGRVRRRLDAVSGRVIRRAVRAQQAPAMEADAFPGLESLRNVRYLVAASATPRDITHSLVGIALPVQAVAGIEARTAWAGISLTLWHRVGTLLRRTFGWARRDRSSAPPKSLTRIP